MVIVDSSVWIDFLNLRATPQTRWLIAAQGTKAVGLISVVLAEVLQGIRHDSKFRAAEQLFHTMPVFESLTSVVSIKSANNFRNLRALGITIRNTIDCLIATFCIENGFPLLHSDSDFEHFELHLGLNVLHP